MPTGGMVVWFYEPVPAHTVWRSVQTDRCVCESESVRIGPLHVIPYPLYLRVNSRQYVYVLTNVNLTRGTTHLWLATPRSTNENYDLRRAAALRRAGASSTESMRLFPPRL